MKPIKLTAEVDESRRLIIDLPDDMPLGTVEVVIQQVSFEPLDPSQPLIREEVKRRMQALGLMAEIDVPPDAVELSEQERHHIWRLVADKRSTLDLVNEDREERF